MRLLYVLGFSLFTCINAIAACDSVPDASEVGDRYLLEEELVHDIKTKLTWQRCGFGQKYTDGQCAGTLKLMTLDEAKLAARKEGKGWRLPTLEELAGLVRKNCLPPMMNRLVFPNVRVISEGKAKYWSSSSDVELPMMTYNIDFISAGIDANTRGIPLAVRWVRRTPNVSKR
jgi:hypothetical protein